MREGSLGIPNAEGVPRLKDIALLLCGKAIASLWPFYSVHNPQFCEALSTWYMQRVAFIHEIPSAVPPGTVPSDADPGDTTTQSVFPGSEINFSVAFNALVRGPSALDSRSPHRSPRERSASVPTVFGFTDRTALSSSSSVSSPCPVSLPRAGREPGLNYIEELLDLCLDVAGVDGRDKAVRELIALMTSQSRLPGEERGEEARAASILPSLTKLFAGVEEDAAVTSAGSITLVFSVWVAVSWNCASFAWQTHIAQALGRWLVALDTMLSTSPPLSQRTGRPPLHRHASARGFYPATDEGLELNIASMQAALRRICEGRALEDRSLIESLVQSGVVVQLPDHNVLERMNGEQTPGQFSTDAQLSHHSVLLSITSGVLLYAQCYLSVRSLEAALHCARMAVLVGHQWRSDELLTLAHYNSFLVHFACQDTPAAAGDIAIMLQLAEASTQLSTDDAYAPRHHAGSLGYLGSALLLLIAPGTVDTSLRSVIVTGDASLATAALGESGGAAFSPISAGSGGGRTAAGPGPAGGHSSVVEQTIAQSVRHALWLSEMESLLDPSSTLATEMITGVTRETMTIIAGYYGVRSCPRQMHTASLGALLAQLDEESATQSPLAAFRPPILLLRETLRQTAHRALAVQVGTMDASTGAGPFRILHDFLIAVEEHYGEAGIKVVESNFFFVSTYRFLCAVWLRNHGYMKSAYQSLTRLSASMLFCSRCCTVSSASAALDEMSLGAAEASTSRVSELHYWPPDHLLLWQHIQYERAQLAHYLGYSASLPEISEALCRVSAASHFAMGVLYADLIATMLWSQRGNHVGALDALDRVTKSAERIGLTLLHAHAQARRVSVLLACSRWREALEALRAMRPAPPPLERWLLLAQLHAESEVLMASAGATEEDLALLVQRHVGLMEACGCFLAEAAQEDSIGIALTEKMCVYACIARLSVTSSPQEQATWDESLQALARELKHRQRQEGKWQLFCSTPMRRVCSEILSGAMLQQFLKTS